ncbi:unnamed protein product [Amoebophrya sp. A25]|nr:unnamed protein product [Amoebophrya sp. A25]|eukprot:GSA25T00012810001.1
MNHNISAGFVECPAIAGLFDRDVYLKLGTEQGGLTVDDYLEFNIVIVRREEKVRPQARNVVQVAANIPPPPGISAGTMQSYMNSQAQMAGGNAGAVTTGEMIMGVTGSGGTPGAVLPGSSGYQQQQPGVAAAAMHMAGTTPTIPPLSAAASVPPGAAGLANSQQPITPAAGPQRAQMQTPTTADIQTAAMMRYGGSESIDRESLQLDEMLAPGGCSYLLYLPEVDVPRSEFIPLKSNRQPDWLIFDLLDNFLSRHELDQAVQHTMAETLSWPIDKAELVKRAPHLAGSADQLWCDPLAYFVSRIDIVKYDFAPELKDRSSVMMWGLLAVTKSLLAFHAFNVPIAYRKFRIAIKLIEAMRLWEPSVQEDRESFIELITSRLNSISAQVMADDQLERLQPIAEYVRARFGAKRSWWRKCSSTWRFLDESWR